jgi:hypothetical protein
MFGSNSSHFGDYCATIGHHIRPEKQGGPIAISMRISRAAHDNWVLIVCTAVMRGPAGGHLRVGDMAPGMSRITPKHATMPVSPSLLKIPGEAQDLIERIHPVAPGTGKIPTVVLHWRPMSFYRNRAIQTTLMGRCVIHQDFSSDDIQRPTETPIRGHGFLQASY